MNFLALLHGLLREIRGDDSSPGLVSLVQLTVHAAVNNLSPSVRS